MFSPRYFPKTYFTGRYWPPIAGVTSVPRSFIAAVLARMRSYNGGSLATLFGDNGSTVIKFFSVKAYGKPSAPYLVIGEPGAIREYHGVGQWIDRGNLNISVYAVGRFAASEFAKAVAASLNDAPLVFRGGELMKLRSRSSQSNPQPAPAKGSPNLYSQVVTVEYWIRGEL
jgi:hypothetical protein